MRSHGAAEWSEDYPWNPALGILPRSGRHEAAKKSAGLIVGMSSGFRKTMGLPLRGSMRMDDIHG